MRAPVEAELHLSSSKRRPRTSSAQARRAPWMRIWRWASSQPRPPSPCRPSASAIPRRSSAPPHRVVRAGQEHGSRGGESAAPALPARTMPGWRRPGQGQRRTALRIGQAHPGQAQTRPPARPAALDALDRHRHAKALAEQLRDRRTELAHRRQHEMAQHQHPDREHAPDDQQHVEKPADGMTPAAARRRQAGGGRGDGCGAAMLVGGSAGCSQDVALKRGCSAAGAWRRQLECRDRARHRTADARAFYQVPRSTSRFLRAALESPASAPNSVPAPPSRPRWGRRAACRATWRACSTASPGWPRRLPPASSARSSRPTCTALRGRARGPLRRRRRRAAPGTAPAAHVGRCATHHCATSRSAPRSPRSPRP